MPVHHGHDSRGSYYRYGQTGHKYYYDPHNHRSRLDAHNRAEKQAMAISIHEGLEGRGKSHNRGVHYHRSGEHILHYHVGQRMIGH